MTDLHCHHDFVDMTYLIDYLKC